MTPRSNRDPSSPEECAYLDLVRTCDLLSRGPAGVLKSADLSATQYNILRILRGAAKGLTCGEIASRMITRDPDVTRLLDRLEKRGFIKRGRETGDRRIVMSQVTPSGIQVLQRLDHPIREIHRKQLGHLRKKDLFKLAALLSAVRSEIE